MDRTTKLLLLLIALGLFANAIVAILRPSTAKAASGFSCHGELKANAWGGEKASIGGYDVNVTCD